MEKLAKIPRAVGTLQPKKLTNLGFQINAPYKASTVSPKPTFNAFNLKSPPKNEVVGTSDNILKRWVNKLETFEDSLNPVVKKIFTKQRIDFPISKDKKTKLYLGKITNAPDGSPYMGFKVTKEF